MGIRPSELGGPSVPHDGQHFEGRARHSMTSRTGGFSTFALMNALLPAARER